MRIILVRHGRPGDVSAAPITGHNIGRWVRGYNAASITRELLVATELRRRGWRGPMVLLRAFWAAAEFDNADSSSS